jgi:CheY-like chemotaxis protein
LSGYGAPNDVAAAMAAGFDKHIIKPAQLSRLEEVLNQVRSDRSAMLGR